MARPVYWLSAVKQFDDFDDEIADEFIDGVTTLGPWAIMTPQSWATHSANAGKCEPGFGQRYKKQSDGKWLKVEG